MVVELLYGIGFCIAWFAGVMLLSFIVWLLSLRWPYAIVAGVCLWLSWMYPTYEWMWQMAAALTAAYGSGRFLLVTLPEYIERYRLFGEIDNRSVTLIPYQGSIVEAVHEFLHDADRTPKQITYRRYLLKRLAQAFGVPSGDLTQFVSSIAGNHYGTNDEGLAIAHIMRFREKGW